MDSDKESQAINPPPVSSTTSKTRSRGRLGGVMAGVQALEHNLEQMEHSLEHNLEHLEHSIEEQIFEPSLRLDAGRFRGVRDEMNADVSKAGLYDVVMRHVTPLSIIVNAIFMGYIADRPKENWMDASEQVFTAFFAQEMFVALYREGLRNYFADEWRYLDFILAWLSILDSWILSAFVVDGPFSVFLVLRALRVLRVIRLLRLLKMKKELMMMTAGLLSSLKTMCWMMILLLLVIYAAALFCLSAISIDAYENYEEFNAELRFGSLSRSMLTMFNIMLLDGWADLIWPVYVAQPMLVFFFIGFLMFTSFGALNVVVGIVSEQAISVGKQHQEIEFEKERRQRMANIMKLADDLFESDKDGRGLSASRLSTLTTGNELLMAELSAVELPRGFSMNDLHVMFDHDYTESLSKDEFIDGMFRLVFNNEFQRDCCVTLQISLVRQQMLETFRELSAEMRVMFGNMGVRGDRVSPEGALPENVACALEPTAAPHTGLELPWRAMTPQMSKIAGWDTECTPHSNAQSFAEDGLACTLREMQAEMRALQAIPSQLQTLSAVPQQLQALRFMLQELKASHEAPHKLPLEEPMKIESATVGNYTAFLQERLDGLEQSILAGQRSLVVEVAAMTTLPEPSPETPLKPIELRKVAQGDLSTGRHTTMSKRTMFRGQPGAFAHAHQTTTAVSDQASLAPCTV